MKPKLSIITLGVADLARARAFYETLGFPVVDETPGIVFFQLEGVRFALYPWDKLAEDIGVDPATIGKGGVTLAHNVPDVPTVARVLAEAEAAGGTIVKPAQDVFWGGHSGYFADPDGHYWEVSYNPFTDLS